MKSVRLMMTALTIALLATAGCKSSPGAATPDEPQAAESEPEAPEEPAEKAEDFTGEVTREGILEGDAGWKAAYDKAEPDAETSKKLGQVEPGATVEVYLGTWCGDSRREVPRFWKALDQAGDVPFELSYVGVDRSFNADEVSLDDVDLEAVPTFVVFRDGDEVGRVVENAPDTIEADLLSLLTGEKTGKISETR